MAFTPTTLIYEDVKNNKGKVNRYKRITGTFANTSGSTGGAIYPGVTIKTFKVGIEGNPATELTNTGGLGTSGLEITTSADIDGCWEVIGIPVTS